MREDMPRSDEIEPRVRNNALRSIFSKRRVNVHDAPLAELGHGIGEYWLGIGTSGENALSIDWLVCPCVFNAKPAPPRNLAVANDCERNAGEFRFPKPLRNRFLPIF